MVRGLSIPSRVDGARDAIRREVDIVRDFLDDVKTRVDASPSKEPRHAKIGLAGEVGSLVKWPLVFVKRTSDNAFQTIQNFARNNRLLLR